ncbi:hypothetical protein ZWY2020_037680 [Hordeum vulgare]|nr:hypothetical protein ZWY2020_037680 [Hordeum vulgare]
MDLVARLLRRLLWLLHRRRRGLAPPHAPLDILCLLARKAGGLLLPPPPPARQPAEEVETSSILAAVLAAGLRRLATGGYGALAPPDEAHPLLLAMADDAGARRVLLRLALVRISAGAPVDAAAPPDPLHAPVDSREQFDRIVFGALVHWARRVAPPPTEPYVLRMLLRLPPHQSRRLLPPTPSARARCTMLAVIFYLALRRLCTTIPREKDAALLDFVSFLRPLSLRLLPSGSEDAHADIPPPPRRAPARLRPRAPTTAAAADDGMHLLIRHALARLPASRVAPPTTALLVVRLALDHVLYVLAIHVLAMMSMVQRRAAAAAARAAAAAEDKLADEESVQVVLVSSADEARAMIRYWVSRAVVDVPPHLPRKEAISIDNILMRSPSLFRRGPVLLSLITE